MLNPERIRHLGREAGSCRAALPGRTIRCPVPSSTNQLWIREELSERRGEKVLPLQRGPSDVPRHSGTSQRAHLHKE